ncbi:MAG: zinc transporter ZupT [Rhizobiaceae bacterium]
MPDLFAPNVLVAFAVCVFASLSTVVGAAFLLRADKADPRALAFGLAFAGGAMVYISLGEIFQKSYTAFLEVYADKQAYTYATYAFFAGVFLLAIVDRLIPNPHNASGTEAKKADPDYVKRVGVMAAIAITVHNLPEGLATFFATLDDPVVGMPLAFAIAVHNIPEGVSIAIPIYYATGSKSKALAATIISALAEPLGAILGYLVLAPFLSPTVFAVVFGMIAGAMVFLALDELLPAAKRYAKGHETVYGMVSGMAVLAASLVLFR